MDTRVYTRENTEMKRERQPDRGRERETERETGRQRDTEADGQRVRDKQKETQTERKKERERERDKCYVSLTSACNLGKRRSSHMVLPLSHQRSPSSSVIRIEQATQPKQDTRINSYGAYIANKAICSCFGEAKEKLSPKTSNGEAIEL